MECSIDSTFLVEAEIETYRIDRDLARTTRREGKASRMADLAATQQAKVDSYNRQLPPMGQPILVGHHSKARHRKSLVRARI